MIWYFLGGWFFLSIVTAAILCRLIHKSKVRDGIGEGDYGSI